MCHEENGVLRLKCVGRANLQRRLFLVCLLLFPAIALLNGCAGLVTQKTAAALKGLFQLSTTSISFGNVTVGKQVTQSVSVTNPGPVAIHITQASVSNAQFSVSGLNMPLALGVGQSSNFAVAVNASSAGSITGTLTVTGDSGSTPVVANLSATAAASQPQLSVSPLAINFGTVTAGSKGSVNLTLNNTGAASLTISSIGVTGSMFAVGGISAPQTINAGQSAQATVTFSPTGTGNDTGSLTIASNDPNNPSISVALSGTAAAAPTGQLSANPASLSFGSVAVGANGTQQIVLSNAGSAAVNISSIAVSGSGYTVSGVTTPVTVSPSSSVTLTATFTPTAAGNDTGTITIASNASDASLAIALSGTATQAGISVSPSSFNFGSLTDGQTKSQAFSITNTGTASLLVSQIAVNGNGFSVSGLTTPTSIAAGTSASFTASFAPSTAGNLTGSISIASNAPNSPDTVQLSGSGVAASVGLTANPTSLAFGSINAGASSSKSVSITNSGNVSLTISGVTVNAKDFATSGVTTPLTLASGQSTTLNVSFSPTASENVTGNITVSTSQGTSAVIAVSASGLQPALTVTPASASFGNVIVGASGTQTIQLTNSGTGTLSISQVSASGTGFSLGTLPLPISLTAGQSSSFSVQFLPPSAGAVTGSVTVTSNAPNSPATVTLSGTGVAATPALTANPTSLAFGSINAGTSSSKTVTITNSGNVSVTISGVTVSGKDFTESGLTTPLTLTPGQSATLNVSFSPAASENVTGNITVSTSQGASAVVAVSGTGLQPALTITPASTSFGNVTVGVSSTQTMQLTNSGTGTLSITQATVSGSGFSLGTLALPISLAAGQSSSFNVVFLPQSAGAVSGSVTIASNAPNSPATVPLSGTGVAATLTLSFSTSSVAFGNVNAGSSSSLPVTVTNTGNGNVTISQISESGTGFTLSGASTPLTLAPNQSTTFNVNFAPTAAGADSGSVTVTSNATGSPNTIPLSGTGLATSHTVTLSWTASTSAVSGYNVYRSTTSGGAYTKINSALVPSETYVDSTVQSGTTYYYVTTAVDASGDESVYSNQATAAIP